jgi:hypothetical protein
VTNVNDSGPGSLRQAIIDANNSPGIGGPGSVVRGLVINGFSGGGIGIGPAGSGSRVESCYVGTDVTGTVAVPNFGPGISITGSPPFNERSRAITARICCGIPKRR